MSSALVMCVLVAKQRLYTVNVCSKYFSIQRKIVKVKFTVNSEILYSHVV